MEFLSSGDTGLTVVLGTDVAPETSARVLQLCANINAADLAGVIEVVPTYLSLLVHYDPLTTTQASLKKAIAALPAGDPASGVKVARWSFPICVEAEGFAPDLETVADYAKRAPRDIVRAMTSTVQTVYMLGFAPGQPYLGDLPANMALPRRENPAPNVPAGAVLTATGKTVIYPNSNPTGWHIIGRTPVLLFDKTAQQPALLSPGDLVQFHEVGLDDYHQIEARVRTGGFAATREFLL